MYVIDAFRIPIRLVVWLALLAGLTWAGFALGADTTATWLHPTEYEDESPLDISEIRETVIEWGRCADDGSFPAAPDGDLIVPAPAISTPIRGLPANVQMCFRAATVVLAGERSEWSLTARAIFLRKPKAPKALAGSAQANAMTVVIQ